MLEKINCPRDVKRLAPEELPVLAEEIRRAIIHRVSSKGGHFGPNMGFVEATIALHYVFDSPKDRMVFDVSHQCYPHKILTGRKQGFLDEAMFGEVSGYTNPDESVHDWFKVGHTSTSVSLASGLAKARDVQGEHYNVIAVIGDGSLSGGEALEGLDFAGEYQGNLIIVVNDNDMSIAENHGGLYRNLALLRETKGMAECNLFKAMGLDYLFVEDGNDLTQLISAFASVKDYPHPVVVHIVTQKGKGYSFAEQHREDWHYHAPFDVATGEVKYGASDTLSYTGMTADYLSERKKVDPSLVVLTSGTPTVGGFTADKRARMGDRFVDVGIAEEHGVGMASGLAKGGANVVYPIYSTFLQRTYDQIQQDLCINSSPATFILFAAGAAGMTDVTHIGYYDMTWLTHIPQAVCLAPAYREEYVAMLDWAMEQKQYPVFIRVPCGQVVSSGEKDTTDYGKLNVAKVLCKGEKAAIVAVGDCVPVALKAAELCQVKLGFRPTVISPVFVSGMDETLLESLKADHTTVVTAEDGVTEGGYGERIATFYATSEMKVTNLGFSKIFRDRYDPAELWEEAGLTPEGILSAIEKNR